MLLLPSTIPCSLSPLTLVSTRLFPRTESAPSHLNSSPHKLPRCPMRNLCSLIKNPLCGACGHPIQVRRLRSSDPGRLSSHSALSSYGLFMSVALWRLFSFYNLWSRTWRVGRLLGLHGFPPHPHPSEGIGQQTTSQQKNGQRKTKMLGTIQKQRQNVPYTDLVIKEQPKPTSDIYFSTFDCSLAMQNWG